MQTLLLFVNGMMLLMVLVAVVKGSRIAYLTGLKTGFASGRSKGYEVGIQVGMAAARDPRGDGRTGMLQPLGGVN